MTEDEYKDLAEMKEKAYHNYNWLYQKYWHSRLSTHQIAKMCGVKGGTIHSYLKKYDIPIRSRQATALLKIKFTQGKDWLYQKYVVEKLSTIKIAKLCNVHSSTIGNWLKTYNIPCREGKYQKDEKHHRWTGGSTKYLDIIARKTWESFWNQNLLKGYVIHHFDRNRKNNIITNLVSMTRASHMKVHAEELNAGRNTT